MIRTIRKPARFLFAAALLGSLGFGASQAFAAPRAMEARACNDSYCAYLCGGLGYCHPKGGSSCACY